MSTHTATVNIGKDKYRTKCTGVEHTFYVDEPTDMDATNTAANPYEILLGSLGACKAITIRMYADRKGWPLESVRLDLEHSRPNGRGNPEHIDISISFTGDLSDEQRARLKEIANACPVQKQSSASSPSNPSSKINPSFDRSNTHRQSTLICQTSGADCELSTDTTDQ